MTTTPLQHVPVRSAAELTQRWSRLLDPAAFSSRSLWLTWFDGAGLQLPVVPTIDDLPELPDRARLSTLRELFSTVAEQTDLDDGHLAMALCRPGPSEITDEDDEWVDALWLEFQNQFDWTWSVHLAADGLVVPLLTTHPQWLP